MNIMNFQATRDLGWDYIFEFRENEGSKSYLKRISEFRDFLISCGQSPELADAGIAIGFKERNESSDRLFMALLDEVDNFEEMSALYAMSRSDFSDGSMREIALKKMKQLESQE